MADLTKYHVYFIDAGNCDIFDIPVEACAWHEVVSKAMDEYRVCGQPYSDIATLRIDHLERT